MNDLNGALNVEMYDESSDIQANSGVPAAELYLDPYIEAEEEVVIASSGEDDETHETNCESSSIPAVSSPAPARLIGAVPLQNDGCFRTPQGFQKTATYPVDAMHGRVDDDYDVMGEEDLDAPSTSTAHLFKKSIKRDPNGSSISDEAPNAKRRVNGQGLYPLERLSIMIGPRLVRLKVVDIDPLNVISDEAEPHFVIHANEDAQAPRGAYKCDLCQRCFAMKRDWSHHMIQVHGMMKPFTCVICGVGFTSGTKLGAHLKTHNAGGKNCCKMCNKSFTRPQAYQLHMKLHEMGKHFCNVCGRSVRNSENLAAHQAACAAMATGELIHLDRPYRYQCNYCEKMFHHLRDKKTHERVHTGEKPYVCGYCGRGFSQSQALTIHIRIHTGERPYECKLCKKQFYDVSALRKHEYKMCVIVEPPPILQIECDMTEVVEEVIETQEMVQVVEEETVETSRMHDYEEPHDDYQPTDDDDSLLLDDDYKTGPC